jgi:CheY-like chemotaxis protein
LGLSISQSLIGLMQGTIKVYSTYGKGSQFVIELPMDLADEVTVEKRNYKPISLFCRYKEEREATEELLKGLGIEYLVVEETEDLKVFEPVLYIESSADELMPDWLSSKEMLYVMSSNSKVAQTLQCKTLHKPIRKNLLGRSLSKFSEVEERISADSKKATQEQFNLKILLVEDNRTNQRLANLMLTKMGCSVEIANDGVEALNLIGNGYDLVLLDCQMPNMDGFECTRMLRSSGQYSDLIIVAMTANAMRGDREKFLEAGMNDYISKPITKLAISEVLSRYIR